MIPIAIVTNAIRILGAGMLAHRYGPSTAEGPRCPGASPGALVLSVGTLL
jgi:hypothetical protein